MVTPSHFQSVCVPTHECPPSHMNLTLKRSVLITVLAPQTQMETRNFQVSQSHTGKPCLKKEQNNNNKKNHKSTNTAPILLRVSVVLPWSDTEVFAHKVSIIAKIVLNTVRNSLSVLLQSGSKTKPFIYSFNIFLLSLVLNKGAFLTLCTTLLLIMKPYSVCVCQYTKYWHQNVVGLGIGMDVASALWVGSTPASTHFLATPRPFLSLGTCSGSLT